MPCMTSGPLGTQQPPTHSSGTALGFGYEPYGAGQVDQRSQPQQLLQPGTEQYQQRMRQQQAAEVRRPYSFARVGGLCISPWISRQQQAAQKAQGTQVQQRSSANTFDNVQIQQVQVRRDTPLLLPCHCVLATEFSLSLL